MSKIFYYCFKIGKWDSIQSLYKKVGGFTQAIYQVSWLASVCLTNWIIDLCLCKAIWYLGRDSRVQVWGRKTWRKSNISQRLLWWSYWVSHRPINITAGSCTWPLTYSQKGCVSRDVWEAMGYHKGSEGSWRNVHKEGIQGNLPCGGTVWWQNPLEFPEDTA